MRVGNIATYPAREGNRKASFESIARQVDVLNVALNEYVDVPDDLKSIKNANFIFPEENLKDCGKFAFTVSARDDVFLCDDDIIYPHDYAEWMIEAWKNIGEENAILGVHGVTYSDYYDGRKRSGRLVYVFDKPLEETVQMNQLGTGTVYLKGQCLPTLEQMRTSAGFVDIRFARLAYERKIKLYCVARPGLWLSEIVNDTSLYLSVTSNLPLCALQEVQAFCGISKNMNI